MDERDRIKRYLTRAYIKFERVMAFFDILKTNVGYSHDMQGLEDTLTIQESILKEDKDKKKVKGYTIDNLKDYHKTLNEFLEWTIFEGTRVVNKEGKRKLKPESETVFPYKFHDLVMKGVNLFGSKIYKHKI